MGLPIFRANFFTLFQGLFVEGINSSCTGLTPGPANSRQGGGAKEAKVRDNWSTH